MLSVYTGIKSNYTTDNIIWLLDEEQEKGSEPRSYKQVWIDCSIGESGTQVKPENQYGVRRKHIRASSLSDSFRLTLEDKVFQKPEPGRTISIDQSE